MRSLIGLLKTARNPTPGVPVMPQAPQPVRLPPMLKDIVVEPVIYSGEAIKHKLIMRFDRGEIIVGMAQNADGLLQLRKDIYAELGMDEAS